MPMNEKPFSHRGHHGTYLTANRCDFRGGVTITDKPKDIAAFASDIAEIISYHAMHIWPELNGFQGYDCIQWDIPVGKPPKAKK